MSVAAGGSARETLDSDIIHKSDTGSCYESRTNNHMAMLSRRLVRAHCTVILGFEAQLSTNTSQSLLVLCGSLSYWPDLIPWFSPKPAVWKERRDCQALIPGRTYCSYF